LKFTIDCPDPCVRMYFIYIRSAGRRCGVCRFRINGATDFYRFRFPRTRFWFRFERGRNDGVPNVIGRVSGPDNTVIQYVFDVEILSIRSTSSFLTNWTYLYVMFYSRQSASGDWRTSDGKHVYRITVDERQKTNSGL